MNDNIVIRDVSQTDQDVWLRLWDGYNAFYQTEVPSQITGLTWQHILDPQSAIFCRIAETTGKVIGFSTSVLHDSTWTAAPSCYLEDLFVDPAYRGHGIGRKLINDLIMLAKTNGWPRVYWHTREDNSARKLYDEFVKADNFVRYRLQF